MQPSPFSRASLSRHAMLVHGACWFLLLACVAASCTSQSVGSGDGPFGGGSSAYVAKDPPAGAYPPAWPRRLPGLRARVFRYGTSQLATSPPNGDELQQLASVAATATPDYTFIDQTLGESGRVYFNGFDVSPVNTYMAPDAAGPIAVLSDPLNTTVVDWTGFVHIPAAGSYDFNIIGADDGACVYINGTGTSGSGTLVTQRNYRQLLNDTSPITFAAPGDYAFELFYMNQVYAGAAGGAGLIFNVSGPGAATFFSLDTNDSVVPSSLGFPAITLGNAQIVTPPDMLDPNMFQVANGSVFPWLPTEDGTQMMTFYLSGQVARSVGTDLLSMQSPTAASATLAPGGPGTFDADGIWLLNAIRKDSDGSLVGLYHAENHTFADGSQGVWSSSGIALSTDDGVTWTKMGQAVGTPAPSTATPGGREIGCMMWQSSKSRWLGIGHGLGFVSSDPNAAPGTWKGYGLGAYSQPEPDTAGSNSESVLPGLSPNMAECKLGYNTYFNQYVMVWRASTENTIRMSASPDGNAWNESIALISSGNPNMIIEYGQLMGPSDVTHGQSAWLLYEQRPSTTGRFRDMVVRNVHFQL